MVAWGWNLSVGSARIPFAEPVLDFGQSLHAFKRADNPHVSNFPLIFLGVAKVLWESLGASVVPGKSARPLNRELESEVDFLWSFTGLARELLLTVF